MSDTVTVNNGQFQVYINNGLPKVYYPQSTTLILDDANPVDNHSSGLTTSSKLLLYYNHS